MKINQVFIRNVELEKKIMYVWNSSEILQILLTYFIWLIITEHIIFVKNLQCIDRLQRLGIRPDFFFQKISNFFLKSQRKAKIWILKIKNRTN